MAFAENAHVAQFLSGDVCKAAPVKPEILKNWLSDRGTIQLTEHDRPARASGSSRLFSYRRLLQVALAVAATRLGINAARAAQNALTFTDRGDSFSSLGAPVVDRWPCQLFPTGKTLLICYPDSDRGRVVNFNRKDRLDDLLERNGHPTAEGVVILDVGAIDRRVKEALGLPPDWLTRTVANR